MLVFLLLMGSHLNALQSASLNQNTQSVNGIEFADRFAGADCGAKINAADRALGTAPGEIRITQACGASWTTAVALSPNHKLQFIQGGTYTIAGGGTLAGGNAITADAGIDVTIKAAVAATSPVFTLNGPGLLVRDVTLDGNLAHQSKNVYAFRINGSAAPTDVVFDHVRVQNWKGWFLRTFVEGGNPVNGLSVTDSTFDTLSAYGLDVTDTNDFVFSHNDVKNWSSAEYGAAIVWDLTDTRSGWKITDNHFTAGSNSGYAIAQTASHPTVTLSDLTISYNTFDSRGGNPKGGAGIGVAAIGATITTNVWLNGPATGGNNRHGLEFYGSDATITGNKISQGVLYVGVPGPGSPSVNLTITGNTVTNHNGDAIWLGGSAVPGKYDKMSQITVAANTLDVTGAHHAITAIDINPANQAQGYDDLVITNNIIYGDSNSTGIGWTPGIASSTGWQIKDNEITGCGYGIRIPATSAVTEISISENRLQTSRIKAIRNDATGGAVRIWNNVTPSLQTAPPPQ